MNALCLSSALHSNDEEMLIQLFPEAVSLCGECGEMHPKMFLTQGQVKGVISEHLSALVFKTHLLQTKDEKSQEVVQLCG